MRNKRGICVAAVAVAILGLSGCSDSGSHRAAKKGSDTGGPIVVYVTNYPLKYFTERIGGEQVEVHFPGPPDEDPACWMPDAQMITRFQEADLILLNGASYEKWVDAVSLPKSIICNTAAEFSSEYIAIEGTQTHSHGPQGEHAHGGTAFTTWLDPTLAWKQADAIRAALTSLRPAHAETFVKNFNSLKNDLEAIDREIADIVAKAPKQPVLFSHPVYQYFARRYGLNARSVHWEPQESPTDAMWKELSGLLDKYPAKSMIWEGEPLASTADKLADLGLGSIVFDPCGNTPRGGDYLATHRKNLAALSKVYSEPP